MRPRTHELSRGLDQTSDSHFTQGRFGRLFRHLKSADFAPADNRDDAEKNAAARAGKYGPAKAEKNGPAKPGENGPLDVLKALAAQMEAKSKPIDGPIPAGYTYLGQFIDHDLTFDPVSSLQRDNDPASIVDYRTPRFDLDCLYGRGPADNPYFYRDDGVRMRLGRRLNNRMKDLGYDVPRPPEPDPRSPNKNDSEKAIIADPRNDENVIIAQLHALFLQFHNRLVDIFEAKAGKTPTFADVQQQVRWHYQWIVLYDFLPRVIDDGIYKEVLPHVTKDKKKVLESPLTPTQTDAGYEPVLKFYQPEEEAFIPVEFSGAAYRFGHSMVRDNYRLNTNKDPGIGGPLAILSKDKDSKMDLRGFRSFRNDWGIEWGLFFEGLDELEPQRSLRIDTSLATALRDLPFPFLGDMPSLAERNLVRGWRLRLPSGQTLAHALGAVPLTEEDLRVGGSVYLRKVSEAFHNNAPLWFYILAEAAKSGERGTLGPVGSRIVMETFIGLLWEDGHSFLRQNPRWKPMTEPFGMTEFIKFARGEKTSINAKAAGFIL